MYLSAHSYFSFRYGTMSPTQLLGTAKGYGIRSLTLTDINSTAGCIEFVREAEAFGINPVLGVDFRNGMQQVFVAIAKNNLGFLEINAYLSKFLRCSTDEDEHLHAGTRARPIPARAPEEWQNVVVIYPWAVAERGKFQLRPNEWAGIHPHEVQRLRLARGSLPENKLVALSPVSFRNKTDFNIHRLLRAIDENILLSKLSPELTAGESECFFTMQELSNLYKEAPQLLLRSQRLVSECEIYFDFSENRPHQNLKTFTGSESDDFDLIKSLCENGLAYRYPKADQAIRERVQKELETIRSKGFVSYFLVNWEIVRYAQRKNYFYVGRGSGANSIVAYLLRITDVDPVELDLYFERFINLYRKTPPDFDIDFSWKDREDITDFIFRRFPNAALLATYSTFQNKAAIRQLGKVFGMPPIEIEALSVNENRATDQLSRTLVKYARLIQDFPSHLSIHAGGILISEKPIHYFTATHVPPKGFSTTQFDMVAAEDVGLYKFDILSQRGLGKIKDSLELIRRNNPGDPEIDIHDLRRFKTDEKVKLLLREGKAIGCFYVESPAMRMLLKKLQVEDYLGLVAASSIIRPGVARSGMMKEYILRSRCPEKRNAAHPVLLEIMPDTFGIMVYQEDVIKVAHIFAGLSLAEADVLRRGMSGKFRSREEFQQVRSSFFKNCRTKDVDKTTAAEIWKQIESFAGYAFSKGHSASYAVESYQSLYLKAYYPLEYLVATLNNGGGFYRPELYINEARLLGARIEAPCVNKSDELAAIDGKTISIGLGSIKDLEAGCTRTILNERKTNGMYTSMEDLVSRTGLPLDQLSLLIRVGALRFIGSSKQQLLWQAHLMYEKLGTGRKSSKQKATGELFARPAVKDFQLPALSVDPLDDSNDELELLGFALCNPFDMMPKKEGAYTIASELEKYSGQKVCMLGYMVAVKDTRTLKGERMNFGTFIDEEGQFIDTVHFPTVAAKYPFRGKGFYKIRGTVVEEFGFFSVEVEEMHKEALIQQSTKKEEVVPAK